MQLLLHIGTEKTGTTSFQRWMNSQRERFAEKRILYPASIGRANHRDLCVACQNFDPRDDGFQDRKLGDEKIHQQFANSTIRKLRAELKSSNADIVVMSSEHLHSRLLEQSEVNHLRDVLAPMFSSIEVIVHLRPQVDLAVSYASMVSKNGRKIDRAWFSKVNEKNRYYNYDLLLQRWTNAFGKLTVLPFRQQPSMVQYFARRYGLNLAAFEPEPRLNEALSWRSIAMVNSLDLSKLPRRVSSRLGVTMHLDKLPSEERLQIGLDLAEEIQGRFRASNERALAYAPGLTLEQLTPDWTKYRKGQTLADLDVTTPYAQELSEVLFHMHHEIAIERLKTAVAELARARAEAQDKQIENWCERAMSLLAAAEAFDANDERLPPIRKRVKQLTASAGNA